MYRPVLRCCANTFFLNPFVGIDASKNQQLRPRKTQGFKTLAEMPPVQSADSNHEVHKTLVTHT
jgi:hypothetical protein